MTLAARAVPPATPDGPRREGHATKPCCRAPPRSSSFSALGSADAAGRAAGAWRASRAPAGRRSARVARPECAQSFGVPTGFRRPRRPAQDFARATPRPAFGARLAIRSHRRVGGGWSWPWLSPALRRWTGGGRGLLPRCATHRFREVTTDERETAGQGGYQLPQEEARAAGTWCMAAAAGAGAQRRRRRRPARRQPSPSIQRPASAFGSFCAPAFRGGTPVRREDAGGSSRMDTAREGLDRPVHARPRPAGPHRQGHARPDRGSTEGRQDDLPQADLERGPRRGPEDPPILPAHRRAPRGGHGF